MTRKVHLLSAYPPGEENFAPEWLVENSRPLTGYEVVHSPEEADIIIFAESHPGSDPYLFRVREHPIFKRFKGKCILSHDVDQCVTLMRTISPTVATWQFNPKTKATLHFLARICENKVLTSTADFDCERRYLFSFDGSSRTNRLRKKIMELEHPRSLLIDRGQSRAWEMTEEELIDYQKAYVDGILMSEFVLSPAGIGPSTNRLFETMQLARPPVIVADTWVPIQGINWDDFSIRVAEKDIPKIPEILEERSGDAIELGRRARRAWEDHFSPEVSLQHLCEAADRLVVNRYRSRDFLFDVWQFLTPFHARNLLRYFFKHRRNANASNFTSTSVA